MAASRGQHEDWEVLVRLHRETNTAVSRGFEQFAEVELKPSMTYTAGVFVARGNDGRSQSMATWMVPETLQELYTISLERSPLSPTAWVSRSDDDAKVTDTIALVSFTRSSVFFCCVCSTHVLLNSRDIHVREGE